MTHSRPTLELTLRRSTTRFDRTPMDATFAPDFREFGRSRRRYSRDQPLLDQRNAQPLDATIHDFAVHLLSDTSAHCTFISEVDLPSKTEWSNRSSLWDRATGRWQLRFHQGTPIPNHHPAQTP